VTALSNSYTVVRLNPGKHKRVAGGHPWAFSNEVQMTPEAKALERGSLVRVTTADGTPLGVAMFNPHSLIAARMVTTNSEAVFDGEELARRIAHAASMRDRLYDVPHYRLIHAEADGLPGVAIDRYGDVAVCQINSAGMDRLADELAAALMSELGIKTVVLRGDSPIRKLEGLDDESRVIGDNPGGAIDVLENGLVYRADPVGGQKTGWFFDQRDNRAFMARLAKDATVLDLYAHSGGFGLACAAAGASHVTMVDRSEATMALAREAAQKAGTQERCTFHTAEAFADLQIRRDRAEHFDVVICDPPAFVRSKKDLGAGIRGYRKLTRMAAKLVAPGGYLAMASCSHHVEPDAYLFQVRRGIQDAERESAILRIASAGPDHPIHPQLPESAYLKFVALRLDQAGLF
jgi:23S rRNA (cytosine1962-C5)-methyltransferase